MYLIASISTTADNFERAWKTLLSRYDNNRILMSGYLAKLFNFPVMSKESASEIRSLFNDFIEAVGALTSLNCLTGKWDVFLVYMLIQRFESATRKSWEDSLGALTTQLTYDTFRYFFGGQGDHLGSC